MRMRRKRHLDERLEACMGLIIFPCAAAGITDLEKPVHLEIGCGKGGFICETARLHPDIFYLALEKQDNVLVTALERVMRSGIGNIAFIRADADRIGEYLPPDSVARIYLNFPTPFFKNTYAKHRLTHEMFLNIYKTVLNSGGRISLRTDNRMMYDFSLLNMRNGGFITECFTGGQRPADGGDYVQTEYEEKFTSQGMEIYYIEAVKTIGRLPLIP